jgi:4-hydroxy-tetrahydrodipicolinate synthase
MIRLFLAGKIEAVREIYFRTLPAVQALFIKSNPDPVKEAMAMMGLPAGKLWLPWVQLRPEERERLPWGVAEVRFVEAVVGWKGPWRFYNFFLLTLFQQMG